MLTLKLQCHVCVYIYIYVHLFCLFIFVKRHLWHLQHPSCLSQREITIVPFEPRWLRFGGWLCSFLGVSLWYGTSRDGVKSHQKTEETVRFFFEHDWWLLLMVVSKIFLDFFLNPETWGKDLIETTNWWFVATRSRWRSFLGEKTARVQENSWIFQLLTADCQCGETLYKIRWK